MADSKLEEKRADVVELDLKELLYILYRKLFIILLAGVLSAAAITLIGLFGVTPIYTSTTKLYVINRQNDNKTTYSDLQTSAVLTQDFMILLQSRPILEKVIYQSGEELSINEFGAMIAVSNPEGTRVLEVSVTDYDPKRAKNLADAIAVVASKELVDTMVMEKINIVEYGNLPVKPEGLNLVRSIISGAVFGIAIASAVILILYYTNDKIRGAEDVERWLGTTTLAFIPLEGEETRQERSYKAAKKKMNLAENNS
jgi:capsular polysaccharide biosynthesis protein